jgi:hypothetical protein
MASARTLAWIERLVWILIYGGLFTLILGIASWRQHAAAGWTLGVIGAVLAVAGAILIWVRSRLEPARTP